MLDLTVCARCWAAVGFSGADHLAVLSRSHARGVAFCPVIQGEYNRPMYFNKGEIPQICQRKFEQGVSFGMQNKEPE